MVEYGVLVSSISEMFTNFAWQLEDIWRSMHWGTIFAIGLGIFIFLYFLLGKK